MVDPAQRVAVKTVEAVRQEEAVVVVAQVLRRASPAQGMISQHVVLLEHLKTTLLQENGSKPVLHSACEMQSYWSR